MRIHPRLHSTLNEVITSRSMNPFVINAVFAAFFVVGRAHRTRTVPWRSPRSVSPAAFAALTSWGAHTARAQYRGRSAAVLFSMLNQRIAEPVALAASVNNWRRHSFPSCIAFITA